MSPGDSRRSLPSHLEMRAGEGLSVVLAALVGRPIGIRVEVQPAVAVRCGLRACFKTGCYPVLKQA